MKRLIKAPFTEEQLSKLWNWQLNPRVHPYTCECGKTLYPIKRGLICICGKLQDWFYDIDS